MSLRRFANLRSDSIPSKSSSSQLASSPVATGTESRREDGDQEAEAANGRDGQGHGDEAEAEEEDLTREVSRLADLIRGTEAPAPVKGLLNSQVPTPIEPTTPIGKDARQLISIPASNGDTINLYVAPNSGGLCRYIGLVSAAGQNRGLGGSCLPTNAPPLDRPLFGVTGQNGIDFVSAWVAPVVARAEVRYANGETVSIPPVHGFGIIEIPPSHLDLEYWPIAFRTIAVNGRVIDAGGTRIFSPPTAQEP